MCVCLSACVTFYLLLALQNTKVTMFFVSFTTETSAGALPYHRILTVWVNSLLQNTHADKLEKVARWDIKCLLLASEAWWERWVRARDILTGQRNNAGEV